MRSITLMRLILPVFLSTMITGCNFESKVSQDLQLGTFGAFYSKIDSGEEFEKHCRTGAYADIIVDLGWGNSKFVFWRGSSYLPYLETEKGRWYVEELIPRRINVILLIFNRFLTILNV